MLNRLKNYLYNILFPASCLGCRQSGFLICDRCLDKIPTARYPIPLKNAALTALMAADCQKNPLLHELVYYYKYNFIRELSKPLGKILIKTAQSIINYYNFGGFDNIILVPVPLHKKRLQWRGFNQAELLSNEINVSLKIPVNNMILRRIKNTKPQMEIENKKERIKNIQNAFELNPIHNSQFIIHNSIVFLIDDISTSGFTLEECAKTLKPLKPKMIIGLTLAKG